MTRLWIALPLIAAASSADALPSEGRSDVEARLMEFAQSYSCTPRQTCSQISSCREANWLLQNCSWGGRLDRDGDGVPCETMC
jgi:hypothetical protein